MFKKVKLNLFWFFKRGTSLDLERRSTRVMYVQQVLTRGHHEDIRELIKDIGIEGIREVFDEIKRYIPLEVKLFWEDFFADHNSVSR